MFRLEVPAAEAERAADLLWAAGATGVEEAAAAEPGWARLTSDADPDAAVLAGLPSQWRGEAVHDDGAWWDGWRPHARAVRVGRLVVRPPWVAPDPPGLVDDLAIEMLLDAGRSFGTGSHPSTTLVLAELQRLLRNGHSVLDVGCGSGALGIAAVLLGAGRVVAVDVDPEAIRATPANAAANGVAGRLDVSDTPIESVPGRFDLVLANLGSPLVVDLAPSIERRCHDHGSIVLSGLLADRWQHVAGAYPGFTVEAAPTAGGWRAVVLQRRRTTSLTRRSSP